MIKSRIDGRRAFLFKTAAFTGALAAPLQAFAARAEASPGRGRGRGPSPDYGPLFPIEDETTGLPLLLLPEDFRYVSFGWTGDPMANGAPTPPAHDGMAAFAFEKGVTRIVRNHEVGAGPDTFAADVSYDPKAGGGTTTLEFDTHRGRLVSSWPSISGTIRNCAGGTTPWGSWLTCEETIEQPAPQNDLTKPHGYIFEVPAMGLAVPEALVDMGRFSHEAVALDPATGYVYETEDAGNNSGFYRFVPREPGHLAAGGTLQMLAIVGLPNADTRVNQPRVARDVAWVDIAEPNPANAVTNSVFSQGFANGGARFARLEGAWYGNGLVYFASTSGGNAGQGQIWEYDPRAETLRLLFESPSADVLNAPDNLCVSPRGGLVLCEDGSGIEYLHGLTASGTIFKFCQNNVVLNGEHNGFVGDFRGSEFCGAAYSPDGKWLFVNVQSPGITFAIRGPWGSGAL
jgi:uncharacterized protein